VKQTEIAVSIYAAHCGATPSNKLVLVSRKFKEKSARAVEHVLAT
jgi:hypothetical protein